MPETIDRYVLKGVLGTGAFGTVWRAHDPVVGIDVALKVLADNWARNYEMRDRFVAEARLGLSVNSTRLVRVFTVNETEEGVPYIVMTYADAGTLSDRMTGISSSGPYRLGDALDIGERIALGLADLHESGNIHRDLKPANVLFQTGPTGEQLLLGDFGLARALDKTAITMISGSPGYVAPEQARGLLQLSAQADLYPLGIILTELLTGEPPVVNTSMASAAQQGSIDVARHFAEHGVVVPVELVRLINQLLHVEPERRPRSAADVARQLAAIAGGSLVEPLAPHRAPPGNDVTVVPTAPLPPHAATTPALQPLVDPGPEQSIAPGRDRMPIMIAGGVAALLLLGAIGFGLTRLGDTNEPTVDGTTAATVEDGSAELASSETTSPTTSAQTESTSASTAAERIETLSRELVLPPGSVINQVETSIGERVEADVAISVDDVVAFYNNLGDWSVTDEARSSEDSAVLVVERGTDRAQVTITRAALTSGTEVTNIVLDGLPAN